MPRFRCVCSRGIVSMGGEAGWLNPFHRPFQSKSSPLHYLVPFAVSSTATPTPPHPKGVGVYFDLDCPTQAMSPFRFPSQASRVSPSGCLFPRLIIQSHCSGCRRIIFSQASEHI
jgi:hypothetical protein